MQSAGLVQKETSVANDPGPPLTRAEKKARAEEWWLAVGEARAAEDDWTGYFENTKMCPDLSGTIP